MENIFEKNKKVILNIPIQDLPTQFSFEGYVLMVGYENTHRLNIKKECEVNLVDSKSLRVISTNWISRIRDEFSLIDYNWFINIKKDNDIIIEIERGRPMGGGFL